MVMYRKVCPEGVQNKCPGGGVWCRGLMSWGDTLILVISRGVQLYHGIAHYVVTWHWRCGAACRDRTTYALPFFHLLRRRCFGEYTM